MDQKSIYNNGIDLIEINDYVIDDDGEYPTTTPTQPSSPSSTSSSSLSSSTTTTSSSSSSSPSSSLSFDPNKLPLVYASLETSVSVIAIIGNLLVIVVFLQDKRLRKVTNFYIISLSFADLLVGAIGIPSAIMTKIGLPRSSMKLCLTMLSLLIVLCTISILNLVAVSIDRYWAILHPLDYHKRISERTACFIICACWILGSVIGFLPLFGWRNEYRDSCYFIPTMNYNFLLFLYFVTIVFPAIIMAISYVRIYIVVVQQLTLNKIRHLNMTELKLSKSKFKDRHKHETISLQDSDDNNSNADPNDFYDNNRANTNDLRRSNQINHDKSKSLINAVMPLGIRRTRKRSSQISQQISMALQQTRSTLKSFSSFDRSISLSDGFDQSISDQSSTIDSIRYNMKRSKPFFRRILCGRYRNKVKNDSFDDDQFMKTTVISNNDNGRNYSRKPYESDGNQMNGQCKGSPYSINHYCNNNQTKSNDSIGIQATKLSYSRREVKKAQKLFVIVVFFMICWIPLYTSNAVQAICRRCPTLSANLLDYLIILSHINSAGSPFLYAFHMKDFRQALRRLICKGAVNRRKLRDLRREELFSISGQRMYSIVSKNLNELNHLDPSMTDGPQQNDRYDRFERKRKSFHESIDRLPSSKINTKIISRNQNAIDSNRNNRDIKLTLPKSDSNFQRYF